MIQAKWRLNPDIHPVITRPTLVFSSIAATSCIYSGFYYSPLLLINYMRCLPSSIIFLFIYLAHHSKINLKINKLWRLPKIEGFILKCRVPPLWPTYIGERRTTFAKVNGIKVRCYGEHIGNLGNIFETWWELKRNIVGTHWEHGKNEKNPSPSPPATPTKTWKEKKQGILIAFLGLPIGCMKILFPREHHHFWPGLIPLAKKTLPKRILER